MTRRGNYSKLLDFAALLLVVAVFLARHPERVKSFFGQFFPRPVSVQPQSSPSPEAIAQAKPAPSPITAVGASPAPAQGNEVVSSPACSGPNVRPAYVRLGGTSLKKLKKRGGIPFSSSNIDCFKVGGLYPIAVAFHAAPSLRAFRLSGATVKVTRIRIFQNVSDPQVFGELERELNYRRDRQVVPKLLKSTGQQNQPIQVLDIQDQGENAKLDEVGRAEQVSADFMSVLNRKEELETALKQGAILIDVRPPAEFARSHDRRAVNVPYFVFAHTRHWRSSISEYGKTDRFMLGRLPKNKTKILVFSGETLVDPAPFRALVTAKLSGWNRLAWFRPGEAGRRGLDSATPARFEGIDSVKTADVEKLLRAGAVMVGVIPPKNFDEIRIPGAINAPYTVAKFYYVPFFPDRKQLKLDERYFSWRKLPPKNKTIILYGIDAYDWAPLRAAIWAKKAGWKVYWFRGGEVEWRHSHPKVD